MAVNVKKIREDCDEMSAGWEQAPDVIFRGIKKSNFDTKRTAARDLEAEIEADEAAVKAKKDRRDDMYADLNNDRVAVGKGVAGHEDYGDDSPLFDAMGFVRKSERKTGLTRKKKNGDEEK